jgi:hypothetical protein
MMRDRNSEILEYAISDQVLQYFRVLIRSVATPKKMESDPLAQQDV